MIEAIRENETRMEAIGFADLPLQAGVLRRSAGAVCGLAGALLANQGNFVSPRLLDWAQSGSLMIMVILGGIGHLYGGAIGAIVAARARGGAVRLHDLLAAPASASILLAIVLFAPQGLAGAFSRKRTG